MKPLIVVFLILLGVFQVSGSSATTEDEAKKSAEEWLSLVDNGKFAQSWKAAGPYLQHASAENVWERKLDIMRKPLGEVLSRKLQSAKFEKGNNFQTADYVQLQFATSFAKKKDAIEIVTPALQKDGTWKVSGYYIK